MNKDSILKIGEPDFRKSRNGILIQIVLTLILSGLLLNSGNMLLAGIALSVILA